MVRACTHRFQAEAVARPIPRMLASSRRSASRISAHPCRMSHVPHHPNAFPPRSVSMAPVHPVSLHQVNSMKKKKGMIIYEMNDSGAACEDGLKCTVNDTCNAQGGCMAGVPNPCQPSAASAGCLISLGCDEGAPGTGCTFLNAPDGSTCGFNNLGNCASGLCVFNCSAIAGENCGFFGDCVPCSVNTTYVDPNSCGHHVFDDQDGPYPVEVCFFPSNMGCACNNNFHGSNCQNGPDSINDLVTWLSCLASQIVTFFLGAVSLLTLLWPFILALLLISLAIFLLLFCCFAGVFNHPVQINTGPHAYVIPSSAPMTVSARIGQWIRRTGQWVTSWKR